MSSISKAARHKRKVRTKDSPSVQTEEDAFKVLDTDSDHSGECALAFEREYNGSLLLSNVKSTQNTTDPYFNLPGPSASAAAFESNIPGPSTSVTQFFPITPLPSRCS